MNGLKNLYLKISETYRSMPRFLRFGVVVFFVSGALDLSYHIFSSFWPGRLDAYLGPDGYYTHLALFFGMVLIVIGVILTKPQPSNPVEIHAAEKSNDRR